MQVAFRVDASPAIGLGHLQRCLALAQALRALAVGVVFVTRELGADAAERIAAAGFEVCPLRSPETGSTVDGPPAHAAWAGVPWSADAGDTAAALGAAAPDWIVVDHYAFDARWHRAVATMLGCRVALIDDLADRDLHGDLLIDHNLAEPDHRHKYASRIADELPILGGPRFALLGPAYADAPRCAPGDAVRSIGIFLGGTDAANLTATALTACREAAGFRGPVEVVSTRANPRHAELAELTRRWPNTHLSLDLPELAAFFARHDLQIGAGGGATWERCCVGAPTLALIAAANQGAVVPALERLGAVASVPEAEVRHVAAIGKALIELLAEPQRLRTLGERSRMLVDGHGARRVALRLTGSTLRVRPATADDVAMLHRWRDDPATRAVSRDPRPIVLADHERWLARTLADPRRSLLVGQVGPVAVGVVRFDRHSDGKVEVSLYLDPALHGLGLGTTLLRAGEAAIRTTGPSSTHLIATVLDANPGSQRLFAAAGYRFIDGQWTKPLSSDALLPEETPAP